MPDGIPDPTEDVRDELHDAVDAAVDAAEKDKAVSDRIEALDKRLSEMAMNPATPAVDYDRIQAMIDAKFAAVPVVTETKDDASDSDSDSDDSDDDASDDVDDAAEAVEDAVEDASSLDEKIAAQASLDIKPEIPERPPIKVHPLFRRVFGRK